MLVLSRHKNESIIIELPEGKIIEMVVVGIRSDKVRLGINADKSISVNRKEIYERKRDARN